MHQAIYQGTQNLPVTYQGTEFEKEVLGGTQIRESIYRTSTLPTSYRPVKYNPEIIGSYGDANLDAGFREGATIRLSGVHREIRGETTVRPSIYRTSTLPTINQGTTVLGTVFGGTSTIRNTINLGTTLNGYDALGTTTVSKTQYGVGTGYNTTGSIMGVGGGVGDLAQDVTYSTKPNNIYGGGVTVTTSTTGNTLGVGGGSLVGVGGSIMGVGGGVGDLAQDVTYSTKPDNRLVYGGIAM